VRVLAAALALLVLAAAGLVLGGLLANRAPLLDPPGLATRLRVYLTTHVAETSQSPTLPELTTPEYAVPVEDLLAAVEAALASLGWEWRRAPDSGDYQAVVTTPVWRFRDDVSARVTDAGPGRSRLDVRSASRVGRGDLGANARHVIDLSAEVRRWLMTGADSSAMGHGAASGRE